MEAYCSMAFWVALAAVAYTYIGYPVLLLCAHFIRPPSRRRSPGSQHQLAPVATVSVVIAVRNEASIVTRRISNVLAQSGHVREVIIGSDGSIDDTVKVARSYPDKRVKVLDFAANRGKALTANDCMSLATGEIVILTDADTEFKPGFINEIVRPFNDPDVGVTVGKLLWRYPDGDRAGAYWSLELALRSLESRQGLLSTATGACMAVRRSCFDPLRADEDMDFTTPIRVVRQGFRVEYVAGAVATDVQPPSVQAEFRARSRTVTRNFAGTARELCHMNPGHNPGLWWSILSHKMLRWLTPVFLIAMPVAAAGSGVSSLREVVLGSYGLAAAAIAAGGYANWRGSRLPVVTLAWNLAVINAGMLAGVTWAMFGRRVTTWEPTGHQAAG